MKVAMSEKLFFKRMKNKTPKEVVKLHRKIFRFRKETSIKSNFKRYSR